MTYVEHMVVTMRKDSVLDGEVVIAGERGTIVHVHGAGEAYEVEFPRDKHPVISLVRPDMIHPTSMK